MPTTLKPRPAKALRTFVRAREGSVATIFAVAMVPVIIAAGVGIDVSRAMSNRANLQDALDSTALALAHLPTNTPQATLNTKANAWLNANLNGQGMGPVTLTVAVTQGQVKLDASADVTTTLTAIAGYTKIPVSAHSTVKYGIGHVEVALVLDNTGSMAGSKLSDLKSSAKSLIATLLASNTAADPSAVKIAVVPFSNTVNVGSTYQTAAWMDGTASAYDGTSTDLFAVNPYNGATVNRFTLFSKLGKTWAGCVEMRPQWVGGIDKSYDILDTAPTSGSPGTQIVPMFAPDEPDDQVSNRWSTSDVYDNNYIPDGTASSVTDWETNQGNTAKYYAGKTVRSGVTDYGNEYGPNYGCGKLAAVQRLTNSSTTLNALIDKMVAVGNTNVPIGLFWGWMMVSPAAPFSDGVAYSTPDVTKIVIILTDGANTDSYSSGTNGDNKSFYSGIGYWWQKLFSTNGGSFTNPAGALNNREAKICANMKAKGLVIYSVPVEVTDNTAKSLLQGCASTDEDAADKHYIDVTDSSQLTAAFASIAGSIGKLRIAQ